MIDKKRRNIIQKAVIVGLALALALFANATSNQSLIYQGRVVRPDGTAVNAGNLTFTLSIYSPVPKKCYSIQKLKL